VGRIYIYVEKQKGGRRGHPTTSHLSLRLGFRATRAETQGSRRDTGVGWAQPRHPCVCAGGISSPGLLSGLAMLLRLISPMGIVTLGSQGILTRLPRIAYWD